MKKCAKDSQTQQKTLALILGGVLIFVSCFAEARQNFRERAHTDTQTAHSAGDIKAEIAFGRSIAARILGRYTLHEDAQLTRYVNLIGTALALHSSRTEIDYYFAVIESPHANAYSAPGGYIFITTGALKHMQDEAELAAVLAHEIAHVTERHIVKVLNIRGTDTSAVAGFGRLLSSSSNTAQTAITQAVDKAINILFAEGYQQQDELSSDRVAVELLAATGYDTLALSRYLMRLEQTLNHSETQHAMTHPPSAERQASLHDFLKQESLDTLDFPNATNRFNHYVSFSQ